MNEAKTIDARGLSCPQPALLARRALQKLGKGTVEVLVDTDTALENVSRVAKNAGWKLTIEPLSDGVHRLVMTK